MIATTLAKKWTVDNLPDLFSSHDPDLCEVLCAEVVADYLQTIQTTAATTGIRRNGPNGSEDSTSSNPESGSLRALNVLHCIQKHITALFAILQGNAENLGVALAPSSSTGLALASSPSSSASPTTSYSHERSASARDRRASDGGSTTKHHNKNTHHNTSASFLTVAEAVKELLSNEENEQRALINVTELLSFCIAQSPEQPDINAVVTACTTALSYRETLEPQRAFAVQRLLLEAFDSDFESTTQVIADTLTPATVTGVVENLASNSIVAETLIALFGSALSAVWMVKPTTKTALFTSQWIALGFPRRLCDYLPCAIRDPAMYHYFYFFKELLKRGYSHSAGPIVDVLLSAPLVPTYVECILRCCEEEGSRRGLYMPDGSAATPVSLAADGMEVLVSIVSLVRKSLVLPETSPMYQTSTQYITPMKVLGEQASRIVALLTAPGRRRSEAAVSPSPAHAPDVVLANAPLQGGLGPLRLAVCELFAEFALFQLGDADRVLIASTFFPAFMRCCELFPQHDALARCLHRCILTIFHRPTLVGETLSDAADRDLLWKYFTQPDTVSLHGGKSFSVLEGLIHLAEVPDTSLSTYCIDVLTNLSALPLFQRAAGGPLENHLARFKTAPSIQERVQNMATPITGDNYDNPGSAVLPPVVHRDTINLAGERFRGSRTGGPSRASRLNGIAKKVSKSAYVIVRHSANDDRPQPVTADMPVDIDALKQEVQDLRDAGSPQVRSYPSFSSMHLGFFSSPTDPADTAAASATAPSPNPTAPAKK